MPLPTVYSETTLARYCHAVLDEVARQLGWTVEGGSYGEIVNEVLLALDTDDLSVWTTTLQREQLRAVARWKAWEQAADALAGYYDVTEDLQSIKRSQMHKAALASAERARDAAAALGVESVYVPGQLTTFSMPSWDPYRRTGGVSSVSEFGV